MRHVDELMDLRAERMDLLQKLNSSSNSRRQAINRRLSVVSKKIQKLCGLCAAGSAKQQI